MPIAIDMSFAFRAQQPTDVLLQFEAAAIPEQQLSNTRTSLSDSPHIARIPAQDSIGERIWVRAEGRFEASYAATASIERVAGTLDELGAVPMRNLPGEAAPYLFDSRYCPADRFQSFIDAEFADRSGGALVATLHDWIAKNFSYTPGSSGPNTNALDSFVERRGVCRDYAHMLITFARAAGIPARFVSAYAPDVSPPDFHALAEVFLEDPAQPEGGAWYLVDATNMSKPDQVVKIGVGRDAADVSFLTSFGPTEFLEKHVSVRQE